MKNILIIDDEFRAEYMKEYLELFAEIKGITEMKVDLFNPSFKMLTSLPKMDKYQFLILDLMFELHNNFTEDINENINFSIYKGLYVMVHIRENLKIPNSKLKIILSTASSKLQIIDLLKPHQVEYYDFFYGKASYDDGALLEYLLK